MPTLHTFGCSITQGFALPDIVKPILNEVTGIPLTGAELEARNQHIDWNKIHIYQPSCHAWPQVLGDRLGISVQNHARRGACFQQIARQCAVHARTIKPQDTVIVMWTYLSRLSLQWPARTAVPLCNTVDVNAGWFGKTVINGFNKLCGLSPSENTTESADQHIQHYIKTATKHTYLDPMGVYNQYYNNMVLQIITAGHLRATGARIIHLSVEPESAVDQLELARLALHQSLQAPYVIPDPTEWYTLTVDHSSCMLLHDPSIPPAENDQHPSVTHHANFAKHVAQLYFDKDL